MKRDSHAPSSYWEEWIAYDLGRIPLMWEALRKPDGNKNYAPQFAFEISKKNYVLMLRRYSRGDEVVDLAQHFACLLDAWEEAERLGKDIWSEQIQYTRHAWEVNLDHYIRCFWLTGLALTLDIPDAQWQRLLTLMDNEGEDALLDRVIAARQPDRKIGDKLCFPKTYRPLMDVLEASANQRPEKLRFFLEKWFLSLKNAGSPKFPSEFRTPYWWDFCADEELGMKGAYFGCWCIEAVAVAKAFGINDNLCLDHPHYPGDLLQDGRSHRYPDVSNPTATSIDSRAASSKVLDVEVTRRPGFFSKWFKRLS